MQLEWEPYSYEGASWNRLLVESLCHVVDWSLERAPELCGDESPDVYLAGFSSGGSAVGAVAFNYSEVKRILLLSAYDSVGDWFYEGISRFTGDIYMAFGSQTQWLASYVKSSEWASLWAPRLRPASPQLRPPVQRGGKQPGLGQGLLLGVQRRR